MEMSKINILRKKYFKQEIRKPKLNEEKQNCTAA